MSSLVTNYGISDVVLVDIPELESIYANAYKACLADPLHAHERAALAIHEIIACIARNRPEEDIRHTRKLKDYLSVNLDRSISSDEMAHILGLSVSQTIRRFKDEWGTTPYQYHLNARIEAAKALLESSTRTIREISEQLGFKDVYHFSGIFKKKTGHPPGHLRNRK